MILNIIKYFTFLMLCFFSHKETAGSATLDHTLLPNQQSEFDSVSLDSIYESEKRQDSMNLISRTESLTYCQRLFQCLMAIVNLFRTTTSPESSDSTLPASSNSLPDSSTPVPWFIKDLMGNVGEKVTVQTINIAYQSRHAKYQEVARAAAKGIARNPHHPEHWDTLKWLMKKGTKEDLIFARERVYSIAMDKEDPRMWDAIICLYTQNPLIDRQRSVICFLNLVQCQDPRYAIAASEYLLISDHQEHQDLAFHYLFSMTLQSDSDVIKARQAALILWPHLQNIPQHIYNLLCDIIRCEKGENLLKAAVYIYEYQQNQDMPNTAHVQFLVHALSKELPNYTSPVHHTKLWLKSALILDKNISLQNFDTKIVADQLRMIVENIEHPEHFKVMEHFIDHCRHSQRSFIHEYLRNNVLTYPCKRRILQMLENRSESDAIITHVLYQAHSMEQKRKH